MGEKNCTHSLSLSAWKEEEEEKSEVEKSLDSRNMLHPNEKGEEKARKKKEL